MWKLQYSLAWSFAEEATALRISANIESVVQIVDVQLQNDSWINKVCVPGPDANVGSGAVHVPERTWGNSVYFSSCLTIYLDNLPAISVGVKALNRTLRQNI